MNTEFYDIISKRKSVRKYSMAPLDANILQQIQRFGEEIKGVDSTIRVKFSYFRYEEVKGLMAVKAPHYVGIYSEEKVNWLLNAGYMQQQMDLYLSANGFGSCWLGMAKPTVALPEAVDGLKFVIMLAFGSPEEEVHRSNKEEFKRKKIEEISNASGYEEILEAARLAPSATNSQNWFFIGRGEELLVCRKHTGILKEPIFARLNTIDAGIALCHLVISLEHHGRKADFSFEKETVPKGYIYLVTVKAEKL